MKDKIGNASADNLRNGYIYSDKIYKCLLCNTQYEDDYIYTFGNRLVNSHKAIQLHINEKHGSVFENLLLTDKAQTGLTDTQKEFLKNYYSGLPDKQIAEKMNISASTVRYQRYNFREKVKQAKLILALSYLLEDKTSGSKIVDETEEKLNTFFTSISPLVLRTFEVKEKNKPFILQTIVKQFEKGKVYSDKEINVILKQIYEDNATLRRSLVDYGYMARTSDCREYWVR